MTALLYSAIGDKTGHKEIVKMLLAKDGIDLNLVDLDGRTPLLWAAIGGDKEIVEMLLAKDGLILTSWTTMV
jgi:ankyrin repeat protein